MSDIDLAKLNLVGLKQTSSGNWPKYIHRPHQPWIIKGVSVVICRGQDLQDMNNSSVVEPGPFYITSNSPYDHDLVQSWKLGLYEDLVTALMVIRLHGNELC